MTSGGPCRVSQCRFRGGGGWWSRWACWFPGPTDPWVAIPIQKLGYVFRDFRSGPRSTFSKPESAGLAPEQRLGKRLRDRKPCGQPAGSTGPGATRNPLPAGIHQGAIDQIHRRISKGGGHHPAKCGAQQASEKRGETAGTPPRRVCAKPPDQAKMVPPLNVRRTMGPC